MLCGNGRKGVSILGREGIGISVFDDVGSVEPHVETWRAFVQERRGKVSVFQSPDWLLPVMREGFGTGDCRETRLVMVHDADGLAAVAPLSIVSRGGARVLEWLGEPLLGYGDIVVREDCDVSDLLPSLVHQLRRRGDRIDAVHLRKVPAHASVAGYFERRDLAPAGDRRAPYAHLGAFESFDGYLATRNRRTLKGYRRKWRKMAELGELSFRVHCPGPSAQELGRRALEMKIEWMAAQGVVSRSFADPSRMDAIVEILGRGESGARVSALCLNERPIAVEIGFVQKDTYYSFIGSIDLNYADLSPGNIQIMETMKWCFSNGIEYFDFLSPDSDYKRSWATSASDSRDWCYSLNVIGKMYEVLYVKYLYNGYLFMRRKLPRISKFYANAIFMKMGGKGILLCVEMARVVPV